MSVYSEQIRQAVRTIADWPKPGIQFSDITPLMHDPKIFRILIDSFVHRYQGQDIQGIAALDARGFLLGAPLAYELGLPLVQKGRRDLESYRRESGRLFYAA